MASSIVEGEKTCEIEIEGRQMGAMLFLVDDSERVWLMRDVIKEEMAAGVSLPLYAPGMSERLNVPAGGRVGFEGVVETLERETYEETGLRMELSGRIEQVSPYFMLVAQRRDVEKKKLHLIGVSVWRMRIEKGCDWHNNLSQAKDFEGRKLGVWVPIEMLGKLSETVSWLEIPSDDVVTMAENGVLNPYWMRPQVLMASRMLMGEVGPEEILKNNLKLMKGLEELAYTLDWEVVNGCMKPSAELGADEKRYLGVE